MYEPSMKVMSHEERQENHIDRISDVAIEEKHLKRKQIPVDKITTRVIDTVTIEQNETENENLIHARNCSNNLLVFSICECFML